MFTEFLLIYFIPCDTHRPHVFPFIKVSHCFLIIDNIPSTFTRKEIKSLKKEIADLCAELEMYYEKDRADKQMLSRRSSAATNGEVGSARKPNIKGRPPSPRDRPSSARSRESERLERERRDKRLTEIRENQAARTIQKGWRKHHEYELQRERDRRLEEFTNNRAAKKIQNQWIKHQHNKNERELDDVSVHSLDFITTYSHSSFQCFVHDIDPKHCDSM